MNANVRLIVRALIVLVTVFLSKYVTNQLEWKAALAAGVLAAFEIFTPVNALVGFNKGTGTAAP